MEAFCDASVQDAHNLVQEPRHRYEWRRLTASIPHRIGFGACYRPTLRHVEYCTSRLAGPSKCGDYLKLQHLKNR